MCILFYANVENLVQRKAFIFQICHIRTVKQSEQHEVFYVDLILLSPILSVLECGRVKHFADVTLFIPDIPPRK